MAYLPANPLTKDAPFAFDESCMKAFGKPRSLFVSAPIMQLPEFSLPFDIVCDASDFAVSATLGQTVSRIPH